MYWTDIPDVISSAAEFGALCLSVFVFLSVSVSLCVSYSISLCLCVSLSLPLSLSLSISVFCLSVSVSVSLSLPLSQRVTKLRYLGLLPLKEKLMFNMAVLVIKAYRNPVPPYLKQFFICSYTRATFRFITLPKPRTDLFITSFSFSGASL